RAEGAYGLRPPLRAHDVRGDARLAQRHAHPRDRGRWRCPEWVHPLRLHELHRIRADERPRRDPLAGSGPDEAARLLREEPQEPAGGREGRDPGQRQEPAVRPLLLDRPRGQGLRQVGERPRWLRLLRGPRRGDAEGRGVVLPDVLRPEQRGDGTRGRPDAGGSLHQGREVLRRPAVAAAVQGEIQRVAREGIPAADLARVKTKMRSDYYAGLELPIYRADAIALAQLLTGNATFVNEVPEKLEAITSADLQRVASTYLTVANRTVVDRKPAPAPAAQK